MSEGQAEDAPLLGSSGPDSLSPADCSPDPAPRHAGPSTHTWPAPTTTAASHSPEAPPPWPPDRWAGAGGAHLSVPLAVAQGEGPKLVRSQSSMDSGCECDLGDGEAAHQPPPTHPAAPQPTPHDPAGFSPLSPSQPGSQSGPPSPPEPSSLAVAAAATSASTAHAYTQLPDREAAAGGDNNHQSCVCDIITGGATPPPPHSNYHPPHYHHLLSPPTTTQDAHTKVTFNFDDDDDDFEQQECGLPAGMNAIETASLTGSEPGEDFKEQLRHHSSTGFPRVPSYSKTGVLSASSSTASMPMCRICHHPQGDGLDTLISPCRCAGTMQFIHQGCLNKWLEVKRYKKAPACELCNYQFHRHKKFRLNHWKLPSCSRADKILHSIFLVCLVVMAACATITVICFKQDRVPPNTKDEAELTKSEVVTLTCGVLFFVAFFVAMYVEVKARNTLYRLFTRFLYLNQTWHIAEYDRRRDSQFSPHAPV